MLIYEKTVNIKKEQLSKLGEITSIAIVDSE